MLNWNRIRGLLHFPLPEELRQRISADTTVSIVSAESIFGVTPIHSSYEWNGGLSGRSNGCVYAAVLCHGRWITLEVAQEWSNARGERFESTVLPIGEQVEKLGITRPAILVLLNEDSEDEGGRSTLTIGIGGRSIRRYLAWRVNTAAAELTNALREAVPDPDPAPKRGPRARLL